MPCNTRASQISVPSPPLRLGHCLKRLPSLNLAGELLHELAAVGADPAPIPHQHDPAEQIPLDHEAIEMRPAVLLVDPRQDSTYQVGERFCTAAVKCQPSVSLWPT